MALYGDLAIIYPRLKSASEYQSFGLDIHDLEVIGLCRNEKENTAELILIYDTLIYIFEGNEMIYAEEGVKILLKKGECAFVPKGSLVTVTAMPVDLRHVSGVISFLPEIIKEYNHKIYKSTSGLILSNNAPQKIDDPEILAFLKTFSTLLKIKDDRISPLIKSKILELLLLIENNSPLHFLRTNLKDNQNKVPLIKDLDLSESISLEDMAKRLGLSLSTFKREFKKAFKEPAKQWLLKKKLEKAYYLLITSSKSIKEISAECGFSDSSHFIRIFKGTYGYSPGSMGKKRAVVESPEKIKH